MFYLEYKINQKYRREYKRNCNKNNQRLYFRALPFSSGAFLYFSSLLTAMASRRTLAAGYSLRTSHMSFLLSTNRSEQPTERTDAVRRFPVDVSSTHSVPTGVRSASLMNRSDYSKIKRNSQPEQIITTEEDRTLEGRTEYYNKISVKRQHEQLKLEVQYNLIYFSRQRRVNIYQFLGTSHSRHVYRYLSIMCKT